MDFSVHFSPYHTIANGFTGFPAYMKYIQNIIYTYLGFYSPVSEIGLFKIGVSITCDLNDENKWTLPIRFNLTIANMEILNSKLLIRLCKLYYR